MKISSLWVVTKPTSRSTMQDVCFRVELPVDLYKQFMGGLKPDDIVAFYDNENSAKEKAHHELEHVLRKELAIRMMLEEYHTGRNQGSKKSL